MNYSAPPVNENFMRPAKKTDMALYGIQISLSQVTRPLENFVYRKHKEDSEADKQEKGVALESAMRLILASIATKNLLEPNGKYIEAINIHGKHLQLIENPENSFF
ncbi:hypothetical protein AYI70_g12403 [Smittium culicis]|uniref:Uncharacterized protein n=1 Tax=Smittium culicis TaxID=133412 RepID=A0A1R1WXM2_9FUNG|nr:hypothetical protein AYI70_g12403 [Smittium culicis]